MVDPKSEDHLTGKGAGGCVAARRFEPEQPTRRRWYANGAARIVSVRERHHSRRDRSGRAATRSARCTLQIPGISARAEQRWLGREAEPELGKIGLAQGDQSGPTVSNHQLGIPVRNHVLEKPRPHAGTLVGVRRAKILDQKGHAAEGPVWKAPEDLLLSLDRKQIDHGIELRVRQFDDCASSLQHLDCADLLAANEVCQAQAVKLGIFGSIHARSVRTACIQRDGTDVPTTFQRPSNRATSSARVLTSALRNSAASWFLTVLGELPRPKAISRLV